MITVLTPTGERPEAFDLCQKQMQRQTYQGPVRWIVIDDGEVPSSVTLQRRNWTVEVIRPEPFWKPGDNTQGRNLKAGLELAGPDCLLTVVEDDDWYHPDWLQYVADNAHRAELVGEGRAIYYNVRGRVWRNLGNTEHASLRCSFMRGDALKSFAKSLETPTRYYDLRLWGLHADKCVTDSRLTVGMKGLPGRPGIATGHDGIRGNYDPNGEHLRSLIGEDADWYLPFYRTSNMKKPIVTRAFRHEHRNWKVGEEFTPKNRFAIELHVHAQKVEWRNVDPAPKREMKIERPAVKMQQAIVEKAPPAVETAPEPVEDQEEQRPRKRGKLSSGL